MYDSITRFLKNLLINQVGLLTLPLSLKSGLLKGTPKFFLFLFFSGAQKSTQYFCQMPHESTGRIQRNQRPQQGTVTANSPHACRPGPTAQHGVASSQSSNENGHGSQGFIRLLSKTTFAGKNVDSLICIYRHLSRGRCLMGLKSPSRNIWAHQDRQRQVILLYTGT